LIRSFDDFDRELRHYCLKRLAELRSLIAGIGEQLHQKGKHAEQRRQHQRATVTILNVGRMNYGA
jgi:hypothetical protein